MKPVTDSLLNRFGADYEASAERHLATLALSKSELSSVAFSSKGANAMRQKFSVEVPTLEVTNQKSSGRCWLFAATNVLRERIAQARNLENFELSQSYLAFWDKFERCNYFLESILETAAGASAHHRRARRRPVGYVRQHRPQIWCGAQGRL